MSVANVLNVISETMVVIQLDTSSSFKIERETIQFLFMRCIVEYVHSRVVISNESEKRNALVRSAGQLCPFSLV